MISLWGLQVRILTILPRLDAVWADALLGSNHAWIFVGNALLPDQEEYLEAGADHVLTKPVREENVRKMLAVADQRKKAHSSGGSAALSTPKTPPDTT